MILHALTLQLKLWLMMAATLVQAVHRHEALATGRDGINP